MFSGNANENTTKFALKLTKMAQNIEKHVSLLLIGIWYLKRHVKPTIGFIYCSYLEACVYARLRMKGLIN